MPLVSTNNLPSFKRLQQEGETIIPQNQAVKQDIREMHIGLLNMMPDGALAATERQFFRLVGESNQIAQFYMHPFTLKELKRSPEGQAHVDEFYTDYETIKEQGLDALIITGANVSGHDLSDEPFWEPLKEIMDWAYENVTSTLCSCLATHAVLQARYEQKRRPLGFKRWGVYSHKVLHKEHPLVAGVNTRFDVPHSRFNQVDSKQFENSGLQILVDSEEAGAPHLAVSEDGFRIVFFQGHPEYDSISLMKEYKREIGRYIDNEREDYPPFPENYFSLQVQAILEEYKDKVEITKTTGNEYPNFPEHLIVHKLDNTWHDTAEAVINNWIGKVYQTTHIERNKPFREGINPDNPLGMQ